MGFLQNINDKMGMTGLKVKNAAPEIMVVGGVIGIIGATVMACRATLKAEEIIDDTKEKLDKIERAYEEYNPDVIDPECDKEPYTEEDKKHDTIKAYAQAGVGFIKTYGPAVALGTASVMCIFGSHKIMRNRNIALAAAYGVLDKGFRKYRERVKEELGDRVDHHFMHGSEDVTIEEKVTDEETGKVKKEKHKGLAIPSTDYEGYNRWFDSSSTQWEPSLEYNLTFLKQAQEYFTLRLQARGYVFLNEVYEYLGLPCTWEGQCVGWIKGYGDDYVSFRFEESTFAGLEDRGTYYVVRKLPNGESVRNADVFLDFNVYGPILELM